MDERSFTPLSPARRRCCSGERAIDQFEATPIAGSEGGQQPFFSPDGKWVGFFARQKL
jgi:hypothetical protein